MSTETKSTQKYIINPNTKRPIRMYSRQHMLLIKKNILKSKYEKPQAFITFDTNESAEVLNKMKKAMPVQQVHLLRDTKIV